MEKRTVYILIGVTAFALGATATVIYYDRKMTKKQAEDDERFAELEKKYNYSLYTSNSKIDFLHKQTTNGFGFLNGKITTLENQTTKAISNCNINITALKKQHDSDFATLQNELYEAQASIEQEEYKPVQLPSIGFRKGKATV